MDAKQFKEYLLLYGADINQWPEKIRRSGLETLDSSLEHRALQEDHDKFDINPEDTGKRYFPF